MKTRTSITPPYLPLVNIVIVSIMTLLVWIALTAYFVRAMSQQTTKQQKQTQKEEKMGNRRTENNELKKRLPSSSLHTITTYGKLETQ